MTVRAESRSVAGKIGRALARLVVVLALLYALVCGVARAVLPSFLFPTHVIERPLPDGPSRPGVERLWITASDGSRVEAWFIPAPLASPERPAPAVMLFHGNGELIDYNLRFADFYGVLGVSTLLPEYRGYGRSGGSPSESSIVEDMRAFRMLLADDPRVDAARIAYHGRSLGGGVASALSASAPPRALVLESTFVSVCSIVNGFCLPGLVCSSPFRTDLVLPTLRCPVLILHGAEDSVIPAWHARRLNELSPGSELWIGPGGHNDFPRDRGAYDTALIEFLGRASMCDEATTPPIEIRNGGQPAAR